jgi:hypothetical protein
VIDTAVRAYLQADQALALLLATYLGKPAIFVHNLVPSSFDRDAPENAGKPYVALRDGERGPYLDGERDFFTQPVEILVQAADEGDAGPVEAVADRIRTLLDGAPIAPFGYEAAGTVIDDGPSPDDPDDLTFGRRLTVLVGLVETA